jgi:threonine synthase
VLELFRGPTSAFKDVALSMLPRLMTAAKEKCGVTDDILILTATSGDTGKAAMEGFCDVPGTKIIVFYPYGGVSAVQRAQMVTQGGGNVCVCAVRGNFDDAQTGVKNVFSAVTEGDLLSGKGVRLSSANSINIGRLAPQVVYYFRAYADLVHAGRIAAGDKVDFVVPTGNFGDILAAFYARRSGLPVGRLICASNSNNVLTDFLRPGVYDKNRPFLQTMSPSMDILVSSNLERLLYLVTGDHAQVAAWMEELRETGRYDVGPRWYARLREEGFAAYFADEAETARTIRAAWEEQGYLADPHTACALSAARQDRTGAGERIPCVALSTASPFKFAAAMLSSLGKAVPESGFDAQDALASLSGESIPAPLGTLRTKKERFPGVVSPADMLAAVKEWLEK